MDKSNNSESIMVDEKLDSRARERVSKMETK